MKLGVISQRIDTIKDYGETRDAIDVKWHELFARMDAGLIPIPNTPENTEIILERIRPDFIVLSGGNTPVVYGGNASSRDTIDEKLIAYAIRNSIPLLGVCRGTQSIALYFGGTLKKVDNHVAVKHKIYGEINRIVNSYHGYAIDSLGNGLDVLSRTETDGNIEGIKHKNYRMYGIMWHPEREDVFDSEDIKLIKEWLDL